MPEKPIRRPDPIVTKSSPLYYVVSMVILMATLFWALWDEDFGQRPWKAFQHEWKQRYSAFLKTAGRRPSSPKRTSSRAPSTSKSSRLTSRFFRPPSLAEMSSRNRLRDLSAKILAVQNVFTDRRAYVNALTYDIETTTSASGKKASSRNWKNTRSETWRRRVSRRQQGEIRFPPTGGNIQRA